MKKNNRRGFTLAELLIVVAIIAVLVAIAIPVFTQQLERSREATDLANIRSAYAEAISDALETGADGAYAQTTVNAVSNGDFDYADVSGIDWFDFSTLSVTNGTPFTVTVTLTGGAASVAVAQS